MLEAHVRIGVLADGYDPVEGILHSRATRDRHSFVFDMMEPLRPVVDRAVLKLVANETFSAGDFVVQSDGTCRLNPELARRVVQAVSLQLSSHEGT
jgi:CRISP-associated protein Cas1